MTHYILSITCILGQGEAVAADVNDEGTLLQLYIHLRNIHTHLIHLRNIHLRIDYLSITCKLHMTYYILSITCILGQGEAVAAEVNDEGTQQRIGRVMSQLHTYIHTYAHVKSFARNMRATA